MAVSPPEAAAPPPARSRALPARAAAPVRWPVRRDRARSVLRGRRQCDGPARSPHVQGRRTACRPPRRPRDHRVGAHEAGHRRALRSAGVEGDRHAERGRPGVLAGDGRRRLRALRRSHPGAKAPGGGARCCPGRRVSLSSSPGPEKDAGIARELRDGGADLRGYVTKDELAELYRGAAALVLPSRFEGFGLPVLEAMASGTPVVAASEPALREVADGAAVYAEDGDFGAATRRALDERDRLSAAGIERARLFTWPEAARRTVEVYRRVLG